MADNSTSSIVRFNDLIKTLSNKTIRKTKNDHINILGTILSNKDFDKLFFTDIQEILSKQELMLSPNFAPTSQLYSTLDMFSHPVLNNTSVPKAVSEFYKKMSKAIEKTENKKTFENTLTNYVETTLEPPVFMLTNMSINLPESPIYKQLMPKSENLLSLYGIKYSGEDILYLANVGFIEPEEPINMLIYKSLYAQEDNSSEYIPPVSYEALLDFYSPEKNPNRLRNLQKTDKITPAFSELHTEMLENVSVQSRKNYFADLISESKENANSAEIFSKELLEYTNNQILPDTSLENNISGEFLKKQYLAKTISISRVLDIYQTAPKYYSALESILTTEEITKAHENNEISDNSLIYISKNSRIAYLQKNNTRLSTMMYLFLHCDDFSIMDLKQLLLENNITDGLDFYIDTGVSPLKIQELYENYLIDYQCIKSLKNSGILSDKDLQKMQISINKDKIYQDIANIKNLPIQNFVDIVPFSNTGIFLDKNSNDIFSNKVTESFKVLDMPDNLSSTPTILHKDKQKKVGFLNNYKIVPLKSANLIALIPQTPTNAIYLMPYQEMAYILYNKHLPNNFAENESIKEVKKNEKLEEELLRTANQFEETQGYLTHLGYLEENTFDQNIEIMKEQYMKIKIKGEN